MVSSQDWCQECIKPKGFTVLPPDVKSKSVTLVKKWADSSAGVSTVQFLGGM